MSLYTWGKNTYGQLGSEPTRVQLPLAPPDDDEVQGDTEPTLLKRFNRQSRGQKPARVRIGGESFVGAAAGEHHTLAVTKYGDVYSCGRDKEGQLGHGEATSLFESTPRKVKALKHVTVVSVACGANHSVVVSSTGRLYEWGFIHTQPDASAQGSSDAQLLALAGPSRASGTANSRLSNVVADSARRWLAATDRDIAGEVESEEDEEMDTERALMHRRMLDNLPQRGREAVPRLARSLLGVRVVSVSAGYAHTVAVSADGRAYSSGQNDRGQLGLGHRIHSGIFRQVVGMQGCFVLEVACGEQHNLARALPGRSSGPSENSQAAALFVWGGGRLGQLGLGSDSTRLAATRNSYMDDVGGGVIGVGAGANHSVCVVASGRVYGWGHAEYNQQGVEVVAGADLMRDHDGFSYFRVPRMIRGLADADIVSVRCGSNFTLAVDNRGVTHSFGWNEGDTLGRGWSGASDPSPGPVLSLPPIVAIAAGSRHGVVVAAEGPGCGRHLSSLLADADSADVELTVPDDARRGIPVHMAVVSARCLYLAGHVQAALKGWEDGVSRQRQGEGEGTSSLPAAELCLEHVTVEIVSLLMRYLYTDELVGDVSGKDLKGLIGLANEMRLPRLESLCVTRLPYYLRRQYTSRNSRTQSSDGTNGSNGSNPEVPPSTLVSEMGTLAGSPRHSDVLLVLPEWGWKFHCHKAILCSAPWWRALLLGGFQEGGKDTMNMTGLLQEGITRSEALEAAVRHVYTNSDDTVVNMDPSSVMEVVILAEYMVLPSLLQACELELTRYVEAESAPFLSSFANKYHLFKLETLCDEILDGSDDGMTELGRSS